MNKWLPLLVVFTVAGVILSGCDRGLTPTPLPTERKTGVSGIPKADWEVKWESALAAAKKEGVVTAITTAWAPEVRPLLTEAFKNKYGIDLEISPTARGAEMVARIQAEQRAGIYSYDFFGTGSTTALNSMKPEGMLGPIEPFLILPEVTDPKNWREGKLPLLDKDRLFLGMAAVKQRYLIYNHDLIRKGEITSYKDVLRPEYVGKIVVNDPTVSGVGVAVFAHLATDIWNTEEAKEFLRLLITRQKAVIERDNRVQIENVARGKYAIGIGNSPEILAGFIRAGAPVIPVDIKEGTLVSAAGGGVTMPAKLAHPNAAMVFLNWLLSKEGQTVFIKGWGTPSMRVDVPLEGIDPLFVFQPGEKVFINTEKFALVMGEWQGIARQVIDAAQK